jgi:hypothetical protein
MYIFFLILFIISLIAAARSMKDFEVPSEVRSVMNSKQVKGTIVFFKNTITHYSSDSSSSSRSN